MTSIFRFGFAVSCLLIVLLSVGVVYAAGSWATNGWTYKPQRTTQGITDYTQFNLSQDKIDTKLQRLVAYGDTGYTTLNEAIATIGATNKVLVIPSAVGSMDVATDTVVPANIALRVERGSYFSIAAGKTLTINGSIEAGPYQIFSCVGTGKVMFYVAADFPTTFPKVQEAYAEWWGAIPDSSTDCTAAINAAITASPNVRLLTGKYNITAELTIPTATGWASTIRGQGIFNTIVSQSTTNAKIFNCTNQTTLTDMAFDYSGIPVAGGTAIGIYYSNSILQNILIYKAWIGIECYQAGGIFCSNLHVYGCYYSGIYVHQCLDCCFVNGIVRASYIDGAQPVDWTDWWAGGGVRLIGDGDGSIGFEGIRFENFDVMLGKYSLYVHATEWSRLKCLSFSQFVNCYFDGAYDGSYLNNCLDLRFTNCWFAWAAHASLQNTQGVILWNTDMVHFDGCMFYSNAKAGMVLTQYSKHTVVNGCTFIANGNWAIANLSDGYGIYVVADTTDFTITNNTFSNEVPAFNDGTTPANILGKQDYGINIETGASDRYIITLNNCYGCLTGGVVDRGTGLNKVVANNFEPKKD